jgi:hypothetical protein
MRHNNDLKHFVSLIFESRILRKEISFLRILDSKIRLTKSGLVVPGRQKGARENGACLCVEDRVQDHLMETRTG